VVRWRRRGLDWRWARWRVWRWAWRSAVVLVHVVNPQSFHWTMDLALPWRAGCWAWCVAVLLAGTLTAWLAGRAAAGRDAVLAVKEIGKSGWRTAARAAKSPAASWWPIADN